MITKIWEKYTNILRFQMQGTLLLSWGVDMIDTEVTQKGLHLTEAEEPLETGDVYTYTHTHMHAHTHTHNARTHTHTSTHTHARTHTHTDKTRILSLPLLMHLYIYIHIYVSEWKLDCFWKGRRIPQTKKKKEKEKKAHTKKVVKTLNNSSCLRFRGKC